MDNAFALLTAKTPAESVDVLVTWIGGVTLLRYRYALLKRHTRSPLERRTGFLISTVALHLVVRGFSWLSPDTVWLGVLALVPATLLPLALAIFCEGLLRRHVPRGVKWLSVIAATIAFVTNIVTGFAGRESDIASQTQLVTLIVTMAALGVVLIRRDKTSLSRAENALVKTIALVAVIALPLVATDFRFVLGWPPARFGTIAALLLALTLLRRPDERQGARRWMMEIFGVGVRAAVVTPMLLLAFPVIVSMSASAGALVTALVLSLAIGDRLAEHSRRRSTRELLRWMARPAASSIEAFGRELRHLPLTADATVTGEAELNAYNVDDLRSLFSDRESVRVLSELRGAEGTNSRGAEQLTDLLSRTNKTHAALLTDRPFRLLLVNMPELPGSDESRLALAAVVRHGQLSALREQPVVASS